VIALPFSIFFDFGYDAILDMKRYPTTLPSPLGIALCLAAQGLLEGKHVSTNDVHGGILRARFAPARGAVIVRGRQPFFINQSGPAGGTLGLLVSVEWSSHIHVTVI
jgi:hypothetical protein